MTQGRFYNSRNGLWSFTGFEREWNKNFDHCYCASKDRKIIERIYIFPKKEIIKRSSIGIVKNPSKGDWYEKYRITDEETIKKMNHS